MAMAGAGLKKPEMLRARAPYDGVATVPAISITTHCANFLYRIVQYAHTLYCVNTTLLPDDQRCDATSLHCTLASSKPEECSGRYPVPRFLFQLQSIALMPTKPTKQGAQTGFRIKDAVPDMEQWTERIR